jgi:stearoyl-CoA desaturase (delta-9 desaturase)
LEVVGSSRHPDRIAWGPSLPFFLVHLVALAAPFAAPATGGLVGLAVGFYALRMFAITAGYHRYFAHRAFQTSRAFQLVLAVLGGASAQKGALWWAAHHRDHHRHSDTEEDLHSPLRRGFWWSHAGWFLVTRHDRTKLERIKDFARYPELRWLDRWHHLPPVALATLLFLAGGWPALLWGFFVSTVFLWHGTFAINSLAHLIGRQRYQTDDDSRNSLLLALVTMGEGWHNNHHFFASTANQGWFWWEVDATYAILKVLGRLGLVWDLRRPPEHLRLAHLVGDDLVGARNFGRASRDRLRAWQAGSPASPALNAVSNPRS